MRIRSVSSQRAPQPLGHYVQATCGAGLLHISGQLPLPAAAEVKYGAPFEEQCRLVLQNFLAIVEAAGASPSDVLKLTAYIVGVENWATFNRVFADMFVDHKPARSVVPVPSLHHGFLIEVDGVALDRR